jgi:hypothetical protein
MLGQFAPLSDKLTVWFSCWACGADRLPVEVRARPDQTDIIQWMQREVQARCYHAHKLYNLLCDQQTFDLVIRMEPDQDWIGQAYKYGHCDEVSFGLGEGT